MKARTISEQHFQERRHIKLTQEYALKSLGSIAHKAGAIKSGLLEEAANECKEDIIHQLIMLDNQINWRNKLSGNFDVGMNHWSDTLSLHCGYFKYEGPNDLLSYKSVTAGSEFISLSIETHRKINHCRVNARYIVERPYTFDETTILQNLGMMRKETENTSTTRTVVSCPLR